MSVAEADVLKYYQSVLSFEHPFHKLILTADWDEPELLRERDVVFIDHAPPEQRRVDLLKYANLSRYIVVHDTNGRQDHHYHIRELWPHFKYILHYGEFFPQTTIVSNFEEIGKIC